MALYPDQAGALGSMGSYRDDGSRNPIDPNLAAQQQRSEQMAASRRAAVNAPTTPSTVKTQREVALARPTPEPTAFVSAMNQVGDAFTNPKPHVAGSQWDFLRKFAPKELPTTDVVPGYTPEQGVRSPRLPGSRSVPRTVGSFEIISDEDKANAVTPEIAQQMYTDALRKEALRKEALRNQGSGITATAPGDGAQGELAGGRVYYESPERRDARRVRNNTGIKVNSAGDMTAVNDAMRRANAIRSQNRLMRMEMMDGVEPGTYTSGGIGGGRTRGGGGVGDVSQNLNKLISSLPLLDVQTEIDGRPRNARSIRADQQYNNELIRAAMQGYFGMQGNADQAGSALELARLRGEYGLRDTALQGQNQLGYAQLQGQNQLANTRLQGENQLASTRLQGANQLASTALTNQGARDRVQFAYDLENSESAQQQNLANWYADAQADLLAKDYTEDDPAWVALDRIYADRLSALQARFQPAPEDRYAEGGLVRGAGYGGAPAAPAVLDEINRYRQYAVGAKSLGLPVISLEEFLNVGDGGRSMQQPTGALAFANGGLVPEDGDPRSVGGKVVVDPDPQAPIDSIPAVIDGQRPAKLDSGEFVIPADVVMHFGTDKLNKMIDAARQQKGASPQE